MTDEILKLISPKLKDAVNFSNANIAAKQEARAQIL